MNEKCALVLSGGGAKGCFEIGAWRALREAGYHFEAIAGASVGSLNAALIAQDAFEAAERLWNSISIEQVVNIPRRFIKNGVLNINSENIKDIQKLNKSLVKGKLDSTPLRRLIESNINEKLIRSRKVDLGIVTYNLSHLKPVEIFIDRMPEGSVADYLLASASFPLFSSTKINGKNFIDGGIHDNLPFRMLKKRGYKNMVVIDISGLGNNRRPDITGTRTLYIKNSLELGTLADIYGILKFDTRFLQNFKELGYLDASRALGKYCGKRYFIEGSTRWLDKIENELMSDRLFHIVKKEFSPFISAKLLRDLKNGNKDRYDFYNELLPEKMRNGKHLALAYLECAAFCCGLEVIQEWKADKFVEAIQAEIRELGNFHLDPAEIEFKQYADFLFSSGSIDKRAEQMYLGSDKMITPFGYEKAAGILLAKGDQNNKRVKKAMLVKFPQLLPAWIATEGLVP